MQVLVTGASGKLGREVCQLLQRLGVQFLAVDKVKHEGLTYPVELVDLLDRNTCNQLLKGVDVLAHFANHPNWYSDHPQKVYSENLTMNFNLFQAASEEICQRIIFSSSIQVFNGQMPSYNREEQEILLPFLPLDSTMPTIPRNSYALSKEATEHMLQYFSTAKGITCIAIRYPLLLNEEELITVMENGGMKRGKCYDAYAYLPLYSGAEIAVKAVFANIDGYRQYFVASKDNLEQRSAKEVIQEQLSHLPTKKPLEAMDSLVDCTLAEVELGWEQPKSLTEALDQHNSFKISNFK